MYLDNQLVAVCSKFFENYKKTDDEQNQIYCTMLYFIHSAPHLSSLYLNWSELKIHEKCALNNQVKPSISKSGKVIYPPVIRAFKYWDMVQDTYGAPGFNCNPLKRGLNEDTDRDLMKLLLVMERIISQINTKRNLMRELSSCNDLRNILYNYKWRIACKNFNRRRGFLTSRRSREDRSDDDTYSTDLNGCGDMMWFSDID